MSKEINVNKILYKIFTTTNFDLKNMKINIQKVLISSLLR